MIKNSFGFTLMLLAILCSNMTMANNLKKAFKALNTGTYDEAILNFKKDLIKTPDDVAVNFGMAKVWSAKDYAQFNLDSAFVFAARAFSKLPLNQENKTTKKYLKYGVRDFTVQELYNKIQKEAFDRSAKVNSIESYNHFIAVFKDSLLLLKAIENRDALAFDAAVNINTYEALKDFLNHYPKAKEQEKATALYEQLLYKQTTADGKPESYKKYMEQYPQAKYFEEAKSEFEQRGLKKVLSENTLDGYVNFQNSYPNHPSIGIVQDSIYAKYTNDGNPALYKDFLRLFPANKNVATAWRELYFLETIHASTTEFETFAKTFPNYPFMDEVQQDLALSKIELKPTLAGDKFAYINAANNEELIHAIFTEANDFYCGLAAVTQEDCDEVCNYYYINKRGDTAFAGVFNYAGDFVEGRAVVGLGNCDEDACKYGVIDKRGKFIVPAIYDEIDDISEGFYAAAIDDKYGYLDSKGNIVMEFKYEDALGFKEKIAAVKTQKGWTFIDTTGTQLTTKYFSNTSSFSSGFCAVTENDSTWGYINHNFKWAILPAYAEAENFNNNFATVAKKEAVKGKKNIFIYQRYKIDISGKIVEKLLAPAASKSSRKRKK